MLHTSRQAWGSLLLVRLRHWFAGLLRLQRSFADSAFESVALNQLYQSEKSRVQGLGLRFRDVVSASIYGGVKIQGLRRRNRLRLGLPHARALPPGWQDFSQGVGICHPWGLHEVGYIFVVPPKGHPIYTLTNVKKEPYIHSPKQKYKPCFT